MSDATATTHDVETLAAALSAAEDELARRAERIAALRDEVDGLRSRLHEQSAEASKDLTARDKKVTALERRVRDLETSVSYRIGHALVRLVKDPALVVKVPGKLVQLVAGRLRRVLGR